MKTAIKYIIAVSSAKGGVGKSTVAVALAKELKARGKKVGILDADVYGPCVHQLLGVSDDQEVMIDEFKMLTPAECAGFKVLSFAFLSGGEPVMLRGPIVTRYLNQMLTQTNWGELDFLVIDMPPGTGDVAITVAQTIKMTGALVVTTPQELSLDVATRGIKMFKSLNVPLLGIVENMSDGPANPEIEQRLGLPVLVRIPLVKDAAIGPYLKTIVDSLI
jgi:ATP-binding protein involved in chromosome partitioning